MTAPIRREDLARIKKLALLPDEVRQSRWAVAVTKLTSLKSLCREHDVGDRFVTCLARHTRQRVEEKAKQPGYLPMEEWSRHREMIVRAVAALEACLRQPSGEERSRLWTLLHELAGEQDEHRRIHGGPVRIIKNNDLLLVEYALRTVLADRDSLPAWAYQTGRHYAERYDSSQGTGLISSSVPMLQDIADFWLAESGLDLETLAAPSTGKKAKQEPEPVATSRTSKETGKKTAKFTPRQGQFLAFIHLYRRLHRRGPAEQDMVIYFGLTPPTVHGMLVKLEGLGLITREPGVARWARVAVPESEIPPLDAVEGPAW